MAERAREVGDRAEVDVRVVTGRLGGGGAVEIPFWEIVEVLDGLCDGLQDIEKLANMPSSGIVARQIMSMGTENMMFSIW